MGSNSRARGRIGTLAVAALTFGGLVAAGPAYAADSAATEASDSTLRWGFRQSFRNYVANPSNTAPEPIAPQSPAEFDGPGESITRPYTFPVAAGVIEDAESFAVAVAGGVTYSYPAHTFTIDLSDLVVVVTGGQASVVADVRVATTSPDFVPVAENNVLIATSSAVTADLTSTALSVEVTDLALSAEGSEALQGFLSAGTELDDLTVSAPVDEGKIPWTPYLSVLSNVIGAESTDITVRGYGFEYGAKEFNRIPGVEGVVGPYVALGTLVDPWRPSLGAGSESRTNVDQIWAVEESLLANPMIGGAGGVAFEEDGSFAGTLSGAASDFDGKPGRPAVYSYTTPPPGIAAWELEVPVTVEVPSVELPVVVAAPKPATVELGSTATFVANVTGADSLQWQSRRGTGAWQDIAGETAGTLKVTPTAVAQSGTQYRVVASNAGGTVESAAATLTVTKASTAVAVKVKKSFRFAAGRTATVTVDAPEGLAPATGAVIVKAGSKVVGKGTLRGGAAKVTLTEKLLPGTRKLVAEFAGNADLEPATSSAVTVLVKKAKAKTAARLAKKKVKAGKRAVVRVRVTSANVKPGGKVKITVRQGKKTVRTLTVRVKGGKVTKVRLPKLAKGKYQVRAQYQGTKKVAKKASKKVVLRVR